MPEPPSAGDRGVESPGPGALALRWVAAFGRFWWDFLIGDTPELFVGGVAVLVVAALVAHAGGARALAWAGLPLLVVAVLGVSLLRAARRD